MNGTLKRIIGWALIAIGLLMVVTVATDDRGFTTRHTHRDGQFSFSFLSPGGGGLMDMIKNPLLYIGLILGIAGVIVLKRAR